MNERKYRLTVVPEVRLADPVVTVLDVELHEGWLLWGDKPRTHPLPPEFAWRAFREWPIEDEKAVLDLIREHGFVTMPDFDVYWNGVFGPGLWDDGQDGRPDYPGRATRLVDAQRHLLLSQVMTLHWLSVENGSDPLPAWTTSALLPTDAPTEAADIHFALALNRLVAPTVTSVTVQTDDGDFTATAPHTIDSGVATQVWNGVVERIPPRPCANANCDNHFVRQQGRALSGQNRTIGVQFCSRSCANATYQRELRRRKKKGQTK